MSDTRQTRNSVLLPEPTLRRLPWYLAYVAMLNQEGVENVSSRRLAQDLAVDASQIAKDLSFINIKGKTRIGYDVAELEEALRNFLGFRNRHNAVMVGAGSLGAALMHDSGLQHYGLNIVAGIDTNPKIADTVIAEIPVYTPDRLAGLVRDMDIRIGIIAVPVEHAQEVADSLVAAGVRALWNFTPRRITVPAGVVVANTSIYSHLAVMYNRLAESDSNSAES
ncbi:MAG: redox-sensing transcriptional repressor Rex [Muribaculaceae bacterium]|nr:redox-sensing transcriptional repressor Rex [Muribaculaceae bacterium]